MAFTWVNSTAKGTIITTDQVSEVRSNILNLDSSISQVTPVAPSVEFNTGLSQHDRIRDDVMDELQTNLDSLKENNWCRGHNLGRYTSDFNVDETNNYLDKYNSEEVNNYSTVFQTDQTGFYTDRWDAYRSNRHRVDRFSYNALYYGERQAAGGGPCIQILHRHCPARYGTERDNYNGDNFNNYGD